jgi:hypothetical protein
MKDCSIPRQGRTAGWRTRLCIAVESLCSASSRRNVGGALRLTREEHAQVAALGIRSAATADWIDDREPDGEH